MTENRGMRASNCKVLTKDEIAFINNKFLFWIDGDNVAIKSKNIQRITYHPKNKKFDVNMKPVRKITYGVIAIEMFERFQQIEEYKHFTLTDIQNAVNISYLTYQPINDQQIIKVLTT